MSDVLLGVFATLTALMGLKLARRACHGGGGCGHGGCASGRCGSGCGHRRGRRRWGPVGRVAELLDLDEAQTRTVEEIFRALRSDGRPLADDLRKTLRSLADVMIEDEVDHVRLGEVWAAQDEVIRKAREKLQAQLLRLHAELRPEQRRRLAELLLRGPRFASCSA